MTYLKLLALLLLIAAGMWCWQTLITARPPDITDITDLGAIEATETGIVIESPATLSKPPSVGIPADKTPMVSRPPPVEPEKDFYQTIIDNNIFLPLGYRPARPAPAYQLIGTSVAAQPAGTTASILDRGSRRLYIVRVGDKIGTSTEGM